LFHQCLLSITGWLVAVSIISCIYLVSKESDEFQTFLDKLLQYHPTDNRVRFAGEMSCETREMVIQKIDDFLVIWRLQAKANQMTVVIYSGSKGCLLSLSQNKLKISQSILLNLMPEELLFLVLAKSKFDVIRPENRALTTRAILIIVVLCFLIIFLLHVNHVIHLLIPLILGPVVYFVSSYLSNNSKKMRINQLLDDADNEALLETHDFESAKSALEKMITLNSKVKQGKFFIESYQRRLLAIIKLNSPPAQ
jgi:hypothetical protein